MSGPILSVPAHRLPAGWYGKLPALGDFHFLLGVRARAEG